MSEIWMDVDAALASVPVNIMPLIDDTDFKTIEAAVVFNQAGLALFWNFTTTAGVTTVTAVTPTSAGVYDWTDFTTSGMYGIEIPASGGASANNDTEGFGHFTGVATGILPWRGPKIGFRAAALNNALIDGGDVLDVSLTEMGGVAQSAADLKDFADDGYNPATNKVTGVLLVDTTTALTDVINASSVVASVSGSVDSVTGDTKQTADHTAGIADIPTVAEFNARTLVAASYFDPAVDAVANVTTVATTTTNTDMRGTNSAALASVCTEARLAELDAANLPTDIAAIPTTAMRGTDGANTTVPDAAGTAPTAVENRQEMDANSTKLATIDNSSVEKNAALSNFPFTMVLTSDHVTPATGLTVTGQRRIDNGSFVNVTGTISEISNGAYEFDALAADTNGTIIMWRFSAATADDRFVSFKTAL